MKDTKKKKTIMNLENLEARTLFAGADDVFASESIELEALDALLDLAVIAANCPEAFETMGNMVTDAAGLVNDHVIEPSVDFVSDLYTDISDTVVDYYSHPENFMGDALSLAGQGVELVGGLLEGSGSIVKTLGEGLEDYAEATRHVGRMILGGAIVSAYLDPSMATMTVVGSLGTAVWGTSKVMPYGGAIGSGLGSATEFLGSGVSALGNWMHSTGENLHV